MTARAPTTDEGGPARAGRRRGAALAAAFAFLSGSLVLGPHELARSEPATGELPAHAVATTELSLDRSALPISGVTDARSATSDVVVAPAAVAPAAVAPSPLRWLPSRGRQCIHRGRYRGFCEGPRRVPEPHGAAAELARELGLGDVKAVSRLLLDPPPSAWVAAAGSAQTLRPLLWPVAEGKLWRGYGRVRRPKARTRRHRGLDIGAPEGTPIRAAQDGLVVYANNEVSGYGNLLVTVHADASVALYAHCSAVYVFPGELVERGRHVADVGHTGIARGSHLHFEYRLQGSTKDPLPHFDPATVPPR